MRHVPGIADLRMQQTFNQPVLNVKVDRTRANEVGPDPARYRQQHAGVAVGQRRRSSPNFWVNPDNKVSYPLVAQTPQYRIDTLSDLENIPVSGADGARSRSCSAALATISQGRAEGVVSHYDVQPTMDLYATVQGRDLGAVARRHPARSSSRRRRRCRPARPW